MLEQKKICALIAEVNQDDKIEIVGLGIAPSDGLRKGIVVDIDKASNSISEAVKKSRENGWY